MASGQITTFSMHCDLYCSACLCRVARCCVLTDTSIIPSYGFWLSCAAWTLQICQTSRPSFRQNPRTLPHSTQTQPKPNLQSFSGLPAWRSAAAVSGLCRSFLRASGHRGLQNNCSVDGVGELGVLLSRVLCQPEATSASRRVG